MLLVLEVLLTVSAWRKGWGPIALLPLAIGVPLGVLVMINTQSMVPGFIADVMVTIVLFVMTSKGRQSQPAPQPAAVPANDATRQNAA